MRHFTCDICKTEFGAASAQPIDATWVAVDGLAVLVTVAVFDEKDGAHYPDLCKPCQGKTFARAKELVK